MTNDRENRLPEARFVKHQRDACRHPKFVVLARALGISPYEAYGLTGALWNWADRERGDGVLSGLTDEEVVYAVGPDTGLDPNKLVEAWVSARLLDRDPETGELSVHNWQAEGRSGAAFAKRRKWSLRANHKRHHENDPHPDSCEFCRDNAAAEAADAAADAPPLQAFGETSKPLDRNWRGEGSKGLDLSDSKTRDARRESPRSGESKKERKRSRFENESAGARAADFGFADDDPERPF